MGNQQSGFTLIELIAVLVILGVLAASVVPKFIDLSDEANAAVVDATAGSIESAASLNYAVAVASNAGVTTDTFVDATDCDSTSVNNLLTDDIDFGTGTGQWAVATTDGSFDAAALGETESCTLTGPSGDTATFTMIYADAP